jgi:hypothetical protein
MFPAKERLIILSDLWGLHDSKWVNTYAIKLSSMFEIDIYDCCALADIDPEIKSGEIRHQLFLNGGIDKAVKSLISSENEPVWLLGFSIGGFIGWKVALENHSIKGLIAVSSTRLRIEKTKPQGMLHLLYGDQDTFIPDTLWLDRIDVPFTIFNGCNHDFYKDFYIAPDSNLDFIPDVVTDICQILENTFLSK